MAIATGSIRLFSVETAKAGAPVTITVLMALLVCLIPLTIGSLPSAIGVAHRSLVTAILSRARVLNQ